MRVLGISSSPREGGNSDTLLREALQRAASAGAEVQRLALREVNVGPCIECGTCYRTGRCHIHDDFPRVLAALLEADRLIFATPIFFMSVPAQAKALIDRCQCLWASKYVLGQPIVDPARRPGRLAAVIAVGGTSGRKMFSCIQSVMKFFFDAIEFSYAANLFVNRVDAKGDVLRHPRALDAAAGLGERIVRADRAPEQPETIELFDMMPSGKEPAE